jgi:hypothetical protein
MPRNKASARHIANRIREAQEFIERPILIENISFYMPNPPGSDYSEAEFITEILEQADCGMLLDINNVFVNSVNHGFEPAEFLKFIPTDRVVQIHLAGHNYYEGKAIDTHSEPVCDPVFEMLELVLQRAKPKGIMVERDGNFPDFDHILGELRRIQSIWDEQNALQRIAVVEDSSIPGARSLGSHSATVPTSAESRTSAKFESITKCESNAKSTSTAVPAARRQKRGKTAVNLAKVESVFAHVVVDKFVRREIVESLESSARSPKEGGFTPAHAEELDLYARITEAGALTAMQMIYPVTKKILGDWWNDAVDMYFHCHQAKGYVLVQIGEKFPEYIASIQEQLPVALAAEMADFEWHRVNTLEARALKYSRLLEPDFSNDTDPASRKPVTNPTLIMRNYSFSIYQLHQELLHGDEGIERLPEPDWTEQIVAFYRDPSDEEARIHPISKHLALMMEEASESKSYKNLFERMLAREGIVRPVEQILSYVETIQDLYRSNLILGDESVGICRERRQPAGSSSSDAKN